jgi:hypothetical protein
LSFVPFLFPEYEPSTSILFLPEVDDDTAGLEVLDVDEELGVAGRLQRGEDLLNGGFDLGTQILKKT